MQKIELLAPAGNLEKLKFAIIYGADAVYCGGHNYGLRYGADNFTIQELKAGTEFAHENNKKIYITVNMIPHNDDLKGLENYLQQLKEIGVDALIVADPAIIRICQENKINIPLHLSTQANAVNWASINFWAEQGIERVILARELSYSEIKEIKDKTKIALEMFIHGAMCISYSGRCLLSNYMVKRDANRGKCAHSCRWQYYLVEEQRPGEYYPIFEDEQGSYIMNSKDLCLIDYIPEIMELGLSSLKIEGRMKSLYYLAIVTKVYREAIDAYYHNPEKYQLKKESKEELRKISHRGYTTGFFLNPPKEEGQNYHTSAYQRSYDFMGIVRDYLPDTKEAVVEVRHKFFLGDQVEILGYKDGPFLTDIKYIINEEGEKVETAPHPQELIKIPVNKAVNKYSLVRRKRGKSCEDK